MGNCTKKQRTPLSISTASMPVFIYFNHHHQTFHRISQSSTTTLSLKPILASPHYYPNYLTNSLFLIQPNHTQSPSPLPSYHLDTTSLIFTSISPLPTSIQLTTTVNDSKQLLAISSNPFNVFVYNQVQDLWTELKPNAKDIENLAKYTSVVYNKQLVILCGVWLGGQFSDKVFLADLKKKKACVEEGKRMESPGRFVNAKGFCVKNQVFVAGGQGEGGKINDKIYFSEGFRRWESVDLGNLAQGDDGFFIECGEGVCFVCFPVVFVVKNKVLIQFLAPDLCCRNEVLSTAECLATKQHTKEDKPSLYKKDSSDKSVSFFLHARIITPINVSLHKTITSYDSDFESQRLYSDEGEDIDSVSVKNPEVLRSGLLEPEDRSKGLGSEDQGSSNASLSVTCSKESSLNYRKTMELLNFISDIFKLKHFREPPNRHRKVFLGDIEQFLGLIEFEVIPSSTYTVIFQAIDASHPLPHNLTRDQKKPLKHLLNLPKKSEYIQKENFIKAIILRLQLSIA